MKYTIIQTKHMGEDVSSSVYSGSLEDLVLDFEDTLGTQSIESIQSIETIDGLMNALRQGDDGYSYLLKQ